MKFFPFREAVESLLAGKTRSDLRYAITYNAQNPTNINIVNIKKILTYFQGTKYLGITYNNKENVKMLREDIVMQTMQEMQRVEKVHRAM